jgi:predicted dehydrogenase
MIRVGAIGCGDHATSTIWPLFAPAGLQCVAAWSRTEARVAPAVERFGIPRAYTNL